MTTLISDKKKALLAYKDEVLRDIKYFENRIKETQSQKNDTSYFDDDDSDSDTIFTLNIGPSIMQLKLEQGMLQTCLHATQELTSLYVLQSEVNVMVEDPVLESERPVTEDGTWREVTAECRVDLVPFSITFFVHKPNRPYGPISYRGLRVLPVKAAHENELQRSILPQLDTPSDAVEVLRSYAVAYRSRRTTLARLAERYPAHLFMEPMADGGYILKCAKLLEVSWILENKWSPVAAFHHRMKFDLEYMEEAYVKIISQAHKELSDPNLTTDERTRLMAKIIATCLEARGPRYESMESDLESENPKSTLNEEIEEPLSKKDSEVMAPPKSLPKRVKPKGKENNADNRKEKATKRPVTDDKSDGAKKAKISKENVIRNSVASAKSKADNVVITNKESSTKALNARDNVQKGSNKGVDKNNTGKAPNVADNVQKDTNQGVGKNKAEKESVDNAKKSNEDNLRKSNKNSNKTSDKNDVNAKSDAMGNTNTNNKKKKLIKEANNEGASNPKISKGQKVSSVHENADINNAKSNKENAKTKEKVINKNITNAKSTVGQDSANINTNSNKHTVTTKKSDSKAKTISTEKNVASAKAVSDKNVEVTTKSVANKAGNVKNTASTNTISTNDVTKKSVAKAKLPNKDVASNAVSNKNEDLISKKRSAGTKSGNMKDIVNKDAISNKNDDITKKSAPSKSTDKTSNINTDDNLNNNIANKVKGKSMKRPISENDAPSEIKDKNLNLQKKKKKSNATNPDAIISNDQNIERTSKENLNKNVKGNSNINNKAENMTEKNNLNNNKLPKNDQPKTINSAQIKNKQTNIDKDNFEKNKPKQHETIQKVTVKSKSRKSKNTDKIDQKIDVAKNRIDGNKKNGHSDKEIVEINDKNNHKINNDKIDNNLNYKMFKTNIKEKIIESVKKIKSPMQKIKILNPRNQMKPKSVGNQNGGQSDGNKKYTKIPQKLSQNGGVTKKNPLRMSPRKMSSISRTDSNLSKSSQISIQKSATGIPRLLKKPVPKTKT